jgi:hypothetical protein
MDILTSASPTRQKETLAALTQRLSQLSVTKRYEAYRDIDWNAPEAKIDRFDPRFGLSPESELGGTRWYQSLPPTAQTEFGLEWLCQTLRYGVAFESCLSRGLLEFAGTLPNRAPEYRYAMHELVEESQHSMMFQEFINRSGCDPHDLPKMNRYYNRRVARFGATFPELFFFCVLSGEIFTDHDNRERLLEREGLHPLVHRILQIHVTEEARHVHFAETFLAQSMPRLSRLRTSVIRVALPVVLDQGARMILRPLPSLVRRYRIPREVMKETFDRSSRHQERIRKIVAPVYALLGGAKT